MSFALYESLLGGNLSINFAIILLGISFILSLLEIPEYKASIYASSIGLFKFKTNNVNSIGFFATSSAKIDEKLSNVFSMKSLFHLLCSPLFLIFFDCNICSQFLRVRFLLLIATLTQPDLKSNFL